MVPARFFVWSKYTGQKTANRNAHRGGRHLEFLCALGQDDVSCKPVDVLNITKWNCWWSLGCRSKVRRQNEWLNPSFLMDLGSWKSDMTNIFPQIKVLRSVRLSQEYLPRAAELQQRKGKAGLIFVMSVNGRNQKFPCCVSCNAPSSSNSNSKPSLLCVFPMAEEQVLWTRKRFCCGQPCTTSVSILVLLHLLVDLKCIHK